jgi:hypothetical protein
LGRTDYERLLQNYEKTSYSFAIGSDWRVPVFVRVGAGNDINHNHNTRNGSHAADHANDDDAFDQLLILPLLPERGTRLRAPLFA